MQSWYIPEPNPDPRRPSLLVYSSCHAYGIIRYLKEHRPDIRGKYNVSAILIHLAAEDPNVRNSKEFIRAFKGADFLINHPLEAGKWKGMRPHEIGLKPSCISVAMESPQASCFWPVVDGVMLGELPVKALLGQGADCEEIIRKFDAATLECYFPERFAADITRMRERDSAADLKCAEFVYQHYRATKMFFTQNHPTMPVLAWITDQFLSRIGHALMGESHALSLPLDTMPGENHYPETAYEWEAYRLQFARRYEWNMGGVTHYHQIIKRICARQTGVGTSQ